VVHGNGDGSKKRCTDELMHYSRNRIQEAHIRFLHFIIYVVTDMVNGNCLINYRYNYIIPIICMLFFLRAFSVAQGLERIKFISI
jgi:hypothetical protein